MLNSNKAASSDLNDKQSSTDAGLQTTNKTIVGAINEIATSFQDGCNTIMQAVTAKGQTPASNSPSDIAIAIENIAVGDPNHGAITSSEFDNLTIQELGVLPLGTTPYGTPINTQLSKSRTIDIGESTYKYDYNFNHVYSCSISKSDITISKLASLNEYTFSQLYALLDNGNSTYIDNLVGKRVIIPNSNSACSRFVIIAKNHEGTNNTLDLHLAGGMGFEGVNQSAIFEESYVQGRLTSFYNGFANDVKNKMVQMPVKYKKYNTTANDFATTNSYVKLPSAYELGFVTGTGSTEAAGPYFTITWMGNGTINYQSNTGSGIPTTNSTHNAKTSRYTVPVEGTLYSYYDYNNNTAYNLFRKRIRYNASLSVSNRASAVNQLLRTTIIESGSAKQAQVSHFGHVFYAGITKFDSPSDQQYTQLCPIIRISY